MNLSRIRISKPVLAYSAYTMAFTMMHSIFSFYYVKVFLERYRIPLGWFQFAQLLYLVWNAINDPLFAYVQDNSHLGFVKTRRHAILYGAPLFALSFLVPWFPWEAQGTGSWITGVHLIVALALYDAMFTFIGLAGCCLFTEISSLHTDRLQLLRISAVGNIFGSSVAVYSCEFTSHRLENYINFQLTCIIMAACSCLLMIFTGRNAHTEFDRKAGRDTDKGDKLISEDNAKPISKLSGISMWRLTWQILTNKNFVCFVTVNFCQEFHRTWQANFAVIVTENLMPPSVVDPAIRSLFHGVLNIFSSVLIVCGISIVGYLGSHRIIMWNFYQKIVVGICLYCFGASNPWILMISMLIDSGYAGAAFGLFNMSLSDIVDEDMQMYDRKHPISSMIFGTNALVVKPAISLSPMLVVAILNSYGYSRLKDPSAEALSSSEIKELHGAMFAIVCFLPVCLAGIQILAWSRYTLRDAHKPSSLALKKRTDLKTVEFG